MTDHSQVRTPTISKLTRHKIRNVLHTLTLLVGIIALFGVVGWSVAGLSGVLICVAFGVGLSLFSPKVAPRHILAAYNGRELREHQTPALFHITEVLSERAGLERAPQLYIIPTDKLNAFTVGRRDDAIIGVTRGLLKAMSPRELSAVLAHEMSHIRHHDMRVIALADGVGRVTRWMSILGQLGVLISLPFIFANQVTVPWLAVLLMIAAPYISGALQMALSRTREYDADLDAARLTGDPEALVRALQKLEHYNRNWLSLLLGPYKRKPHHEPSLLRTHPDMDKRVARLKEMEEDASLWLTLEDLPQSYYATNQRPRMRYAVPLRGGGFFITRGEA